MLQAHKMGQSTVRFGRANAAYVNIQIHQYEVVLCTYNPSRITNATLTWTQLQQKGTALRGDERGVCENCKKKKHVLAAETTTYAPSTKHLTTRLNSSQLL